MKLLFDANLSPRLVDRLAELFPDSVHVFDTGLARFTPDETIWEHAGAHGFTIVTADSDFLALASSRGAPAPACPFGLRNWNNAREQLRATLVIRNKT
ncbi:MAG: DUF5615 family PIN-like protein [Bryobacteraceae bacterium]